MDGPYKVKRAGDGWVLVGPTMPEEDGNWFSEGRLVEALADAHKLNAAYMAGKQARD